MSAMRLGVVDEEHDALGARAIQRFRAAHPAFPAPLRVGTLLADHDQPLAIGQFAVFYSAVVAFNLEPDFKTKGVAQPIDGSRRVLVKDGAREPRPVARGGFHAGLRWVKYGPRGRRPDDSIFACIHNKCTDMAAKFGDLMIEKRSIDYVPIAERHGKVWHLWPVWFSGDAHLATVATGVVGVALGGNLLWMAIAVLFGCAFGTFFMAFHSTQGPQLGLPQMIQSRPQFGYVGALLVWGVALIAYIGFNAFNQILPAQTVL